ncbi:MATE family efflux transporter [Spirosoma soli]|uniref:MATE family efflux transporter n=1 Tax=Spirosoma soli TaxID=1770529 RepID=A0ABW5MAS0_9BACT
MNAPNPLGEAPIKSLFFSYYGPALISILSTTLHQVINGILLGQQVGKEGLAAVGLYGPVIITFIALTLPVVIGSGILIGKKVGAGEYGSVQTIFQFATTLALVLGGAIAVSTPFFLKYVVDFLVGSSNTAIARNTADYMFWQLLGLPFFFLSMFWGGFVRNDGSPKISRNASLIAVTTNIVLDLLFIVGLHWGVEGASVATVIASLASATYLFLHIQKGNNHFGFHKFRFTLNYSGWKELLTFGLPTFASELSFSIGLLIISHSLVNYGSLAVSAFGLVNYLSFVFIRLFTAAMIASLPILSFNIGARLPQRVLETVRFSVGFTLVIGVIVTTLGVVAPNLFITLFSGDKTEEFRQVAGGAMSLYFLLFLAAGPNYILSAYLQSIGKSTLSTLINGLKGVVFVSVFISLLPSYFQMGLNGVWLSRSLAEGCTLLLVGLYTYLRKETYYHERAILARR